MRKIPGNTEMAAVALRRNPRKRLTTPEDVAKSMLALSMPATDWLTGNTIYVDGGEAISG